MPEFGNRDILRESDIFRAKAELTAIFSVINQAIDNGQKQELLDVLKILLQVLAEYQDLTQSDEAYIRVREYIIDVKLAVGALDLVVRVESWKAIEAWHQAGQPSFILSFDELKSMVDLSVG